VVFSGVDLFRKSTDIWDAVVTTIGTVTHIPVSRKSKMKDNNSSVYSDKQPVQPACKLCPCSHIHSLALNHCLLSLFHSSKMHHGRVDAVHISASLHTTLAYLLYQTRHGPNDAPLLLHCVPHINCLDPSFLPDPLRTESHFKKVRF
jgi:hypothetical protein